MVLVFGDLACPNNQYANAFISHLLQPWQLTHYAPSSGREGLITGRNRKV